MERIENSSIALEVEEKGAAITSLVLKENDSQRIWQRDPKYWDGSDPILFPFVGRMKDGVYEYKGKRYGMTIHGFAGSVIYTLLEKTETSLTLCHENRNNPSYPFDFDLFVKYTLCGNTVRREVKVSNLGKESMHYGIGFHPAFAIPFDSGLSFGDYRLYFPSASENVRRCVFSEESVLDTGKTEPYELEEGNTISLRHDLFDNDAIILKGAGGKARIVSSASAHGIEIRFPGYPILGIWHTNKTDAGFVCIEPWMSLPGKDGEILDIEKKEDFIILDGGKEKIHSMEIEVF